MPRPSSPSHLHPALTLPHLPSPSLPCLTCLTFSSFSPASTSLHLPPHRLTFLTCLNLPHPASPASVSYTHLTLPPICSV
eukprot:2184489-Prymnesium_polylepis.1